MESREWQIGEISGSIMPQKDFGYNSRRILDQIKERNLPNGGSENWAIPSAMTN
jgi:hypothetical protein